MVEFEFLDWIVGYSKVGENSGKEIGTDSLCLLGEMEASCWLIHAHLDQHRSLPRIDEKDSKDRSIGIKRTKQLAEAGKNPLLNGFRKELRKKKLSMPKRKAISV